MNNFKEVRTIEHEQGQEQRYATFKITQIIWLLLGLLEAGIALRVVFRLLGVNGDNPFATLLYGLTGFFIAPFASLAKAPTGYGMVLEVSSIIAMIVYLLIAWAIERIVYVSFYRQRGDVSVRQTIVDNHTTPLQPAVNTTQTTVTKHTGI